MSQQKSHLKAIMIECFHSSGQHLCKFIGTKESVCIRKEFNSHRTGLGHQHGRRFIVLEHQYGRRDVMWKHSISAAASSVLFRHYRVFSLTWPVYMQIYWNKRKRLHKKRVQLSQDWFGTPTWLPFHCFGTPIWPPWRHVKTLYRAFLLTWPASMQIYWNKRKRLHKKRVQLPKDWFGTPAWPVFHCFGTLIWPPWPHVKTLYSASGYAGRCFKH